MKHSSSPLWYLLQPLYAYIHTDIGYNQYISVIEISYSVSKSDLVMVHRIHTNCDTGMLHLII